MRAGKHDIEVVNFHYKLILMQNELSSKGCNEIALTKLKRRNLRDCYRRTAYCINLLCTRGGIIGNIVED